MRHFRVMPAHFQMHRARATGGRLAKCLPDHIGQTFNGIDMGVEFGGVLELRVILDFLIGMAMTRHRCRPAGHGNHRRRSEISILQTRRQIGATDVLGHTNARLERRTRIAIGHVGRGFFSVSHDALDPPAFHFNEGFQQHLRHIKHMRDAVAADRFGNKPHTSHFWHITSLLSNTRLANARWLTVRDRCACMSHEV